MNNIFDYFKANVIAVYYNERNEKENRPPFEMEKWFPNKKILGLTLSWVKSKTSVPIALNLSKYDADLLYRDFGGFEVQSTELAFFREGYLWKEEDRKNYLEIVNSNNLQALDIFLRKIYDEIRDLILSAAVSREIMRWDLVLNGKITMSSANTGVSLSYDYKLDADQKQEVGVKWSASETATPFTDLLNCIEEAEERHGEPIKYVYMNAKDLDKIVKAKSTAELFKNNYWGVPTRVLVKQYLQTYDDKDFEIIIYKKRYATKDGNHYYLPEGKILLLPDVKLGNTNFGPTPEETDLMYANNGADVSIVDTGVAVSTAISGNAPIKREIWVSQSVLPSLEGAEYITTLDVTTGTDGTKVNSARV